MKTLLTDRKPNLQQIIQRGHNITKLVDAPPLQHKLTNLADKWQEIETKLTHDLDRLTELLDTWQRFDKESLEFVPWLARAMEQLSIWSHPEEGDKVPEPVAIRMDKFMVGVG